MSEHFARSSHGIFLSYMSNKHIKFYENVIGRAKTHAYNVYHVLEPTRDE